MHRTLSNFLNRRKKATILKRCQSDKTASDENENITFIMYYNHENENITIVNI